MSKQMRFWLTFGLLLCTLLQTAHADVLNDLLKQVKKNHINEVQQDQQREAYFLATLSEQDALLQQAEADLSAQKKRTQTVKARLEINNKKLFDLEQQLKQKSTGLTDLFAVVRQAAGESLALFQNSIVSTEFPNRKTLLKHLVQTETLPTPDDLTALWYELQNEMTQAGKVHQFATTIITANGTEQTRQVTRVGTFNLISQGQYLQYLPKTSQIISLQRQPPEHFVKMAAQLEQTQTGYAAFALDPSHGSLLNLLTLTPDWQERLQQGGIVGYIIVAIGILGLIISAERYIGLSLSSRQIKRQKEQPQQHNLNNPLGRVLSVFTPSQPMSTETLGLKLDEAILRETPSLEKRLLMLGLFATICPLLGLLGTVIGMIETFQSIALFGTGDPKLMSAGISQALITTGLGLIVALPLILLHGFLQTKSNTLIQILDEESAGLIASYAGANVALSTA
jgi:biopolymer transport protein ExbB